MKKTSTTRRGLSLLLVLAMILGLMPQIVLPQHVHAASNLENGFEGQDADVFSALGFDTSEIPEGFNPEETDNPYGRDTILGNQVWEPYVGTGGSYAIYGRDDNTVSPSAVSGTGGSSLWSDPGMAMYAVAAADFDGDGLQGEVVYVGFDKIYSGNETKANLKMAVVDAKNGTVLDTKQLGQVSPAYVHTYDGPAYTKHDFAWQNLLQVTAGDYDGDGIYEIAVYVAEVGQSRVDIYKYQKTSQSGDRDWLEMTNWDRVWTYVISGREDKVPNMVSLVSADLNRDGVDDLGVAYGRAVLYGSGDYATEVEKSKAAIMWGAKSDMLQKISGLYLDESNLGELARVSLITGDLDQDGYKELIATGQPVSDLAKYGSSDRTDYNTTRSVTSYIYDSAQGLVINNSALYKPVDGSYTTIDDGEGNKTTQWQSGNGFDNYYYSDPSMRTNAAVVRLEGHDYPYLYLDSCLYESTQGQLMLKAVLDEASYDGENTLSGAGFWGAYSSGTKRGYYMEYGAVSADINGKGYDMLMTNMYRQNSQGNSHNYHYATLYSIGESGRLATQRSGITGSGTESTFTPAALTMVDVDMDTVIIEYTGVHYLTYSDPKVLAIIAAAPYFEDVDVISNYDYAWQNTTSFSRVNGKGRSDLVAVDLEIGAYVSSEVEVGGGKAEIETSINYTLEWQEETTKTTEYTLTFETSQNEDAVAFYSIPTENYVYKIYTPDGEGGYKESTDIISNTFTPCYQVLNLDYYESIQGGYDCLPKIRGKVITSTPGDPSSYPKSTIGYNVIAQWNDDPAGVSFGNGSITQEITVTNEYAESYNMGGAWDFKLGGGAGINAFGQEFDTTGGVQWSLNPTGGWTNINLSGSVFSGTVANMPLKFQDYGYYYSWRLFAYRYEFVDPTLSIVDRHFNAAMGIDASIPVITYVVGDVSQPPELPKDFQQDYDRSTSNMNVLTWTYDQPFSSFKIYKYFDFPVGGGLQLVKEIPSSTADYTLKYGEDGKPYKEYFFEDTNLAPYTEYQYSIQVERLSKVPPLSAPSGNMVARTKAAKGYPTMVLAESDGENDGKLLIYPDKNATLTAQVTGPDGEAPASYYTTVQYQWQKKERGMWTDLVGKTQAELLFANAGVDSAGEYRCRINVLTNTDATAITAYTDSAVLTHSKRSAYIDEFYVKDIAGGGVQLYATVKNGHWDSASIPDGTVTFNLTNNLTGQNFQYTVELDAAGEAASIRDSGLPEGMYTAQAYYSGSFKFKSASQEILYLSQRSSGYDIDAPNSVTYGDGAVATYRKVTKDAGMTLTQEAAPDSYALLKAEPVSTIAIPYVGSLVNGNSHSLLDGSSYRFQYDGRTYYFTSSRDGSFSGAFQIESNHIILSETNEYLSFTNDGGKFTIAENTPAGNYLIKMVTDGTTTYTPISIAKRPVTLQLPTQKTGEGLAPSNILLGELEKVGGTWASCDMENGVLSKSLAEVELNAAYVNTAGTVFDRTNVSELCGYYVIQVADTQSPQYPNYTITLLDGSVTVIGATRDVMIGSRPFEGQSVGAVYAVSPEYASTRLDISQTGALLQSHATGTRLVFNAVPDAGYEIYDWYINGVSMGSKATSLAYVLLAEDTTVEVQFAIKQNTLTFDTAGDAEGGAIICSDPDLTSNSSVLANALFTFTAQAKEGYHFKEWRYTELGKGTSYDDTDDGEAASSFLLQMPANSCSVYAVFERDYYTFSYSDRGDETGLTAWYMGSPNGDSTAGLEKIVIQPGQKIKGDSVITVEAAPGYGLNADYAFISEGTQGAADYDAGTYVLQLTENTTVTAVTERYSYDLTLKIDAHINDTFPTGTRLTYAIDGRQYSLDYTETTNSILISDIPGGVPVTASIAYPGYYDLNGWVGPDSVLTATGEADKLAVKLPDNGQVEDGVSYWYTTVVGSSSATRYFVANANGTAVPDGDQVTVYAAGEEMTIPALYRDETVTVHITEKPQHFVDITDITGHGTYAITVPDGGRQTTGAGNVVRVMVHDGDDLSVLVTPEQKWSVSYWQAKTASMDEAVKVRATSLKYTIEDIREDYTFTPIFSSSTYNTISWPSISQDQNKITLSPISGYLSSVSAGSDFKFTLSGAGLSIINQVFANGEPFVDAASENAGDYVVENGVYTIKNIQKNQVITVSKKPTGITVNGEDVVALSGPGWIYDHDSKTLTITKTGLTVSGSPTLEGMDGFSIQVAASASSVTLENLNVTTLTDPLLKIDTAGETSLVLSGKNVLEGANTVIESSGNLIIRGNGVADVTSTALSSSVIYINGDVQVTGNCTLNVKAGMRAIGVEVEGDLTVGDQEQTLSPTLRINQARETNLMSPVVKPALDGSTITVYSGELLTRSNFVVILGDNINIYGGILESCAEQSHAQAVLLKGDGYFRVYDESGYLLRYSRTTDEEVTSEAILSRNYSNTDYDDRTAASDEYYTYFRISPLRSDDTGGNTTLSVTYKGKTYNGTLSGEPYKYYYIDPDGSGNSIRAFVNHPPYSSQNAQYYSNSTPQEDWIIVARYGASGDQADLESSTLMWSYYDTLDGHEINGWVPALTYEPVMMDYELSGGNIDTLDNSIEVIAGVNKLTLNNLTAGSLHTAGVPVYLVGDNYLTSVSNVPLWTGGDLKLYSDGTGTLTLNANTIGNDLKHALVANSVSLYNVRSLTAYAGISAISAGTNVEVRFYDQEAQLPYGLGWCMDEGTNGTDAETLASAVSGGASYVKIYADTTDGKLTPQILTYDKGDSQKQVQLHLTNMAQNGKVIGLERLTENGVTYVELTLIDVNGQETVLKLSATQADGYCGIFTETAEGLALTLDMSASPLKDLVTGTYTIRASFKDIDGFKYPQDATLKLTHDAVSTGGLSVNPITATVGRGKSITFTTAYTGIKPGTYKWFINGEPVEGTSGSSYTLTVPLDAQLDGQIQVSVKSYDGDVELGTSNAIVTVSPAAQSIEISTQQETAAQDGSYTVHHITDGSTVKTWQFATAVTMNGGEADPACIRWSLWGNELRTTTVDPNTGLLTISPRESGTNGKLQLTVTYMNPDGTSLKKTVDIHLSTDAYIELSVTDGIHGTVTGGNNYVAADSQITLTATADENHGVACWYVNGEALENESGNTLTLTAAKMTYYKVSVQFTHHYSGEALDSNSHWLQCSCGDKTQVEAHYDHDRDHKCDLCAHVMTECADTDKDHYCDRCDAELTRCTDENKDHSCNLCGDVMTVCTDEDLDHICDWCGQSISRCADENSNHLCDHCGKQLSDCADEDKDHSCDTCGRISSCTDENTDHKCDICDKELSTCADENADHKCDTCGKELSTCTDENTDHNCDTCGKELSSCEDTDQDGSCDICGKVLSVHECADEDKDHLCDTCGETVSSCVDEETDDEGKTDHICDICGKPNTVCTDENQDHNCDVCEEKLTDCTDTDDHLCDICQKPLTSCTDSDHNDKCDLCGAATSVHADEDNDHKCDVCKLPLSECNDAQGDHKCDVCKKILSECVDGNADHACDICGTQMGTHAPGEGSHLCQYCGKSFDRCADNDHDHKCDTCGKEMTTCTDSDDHKCDICGEELTSCADDNRDHSCDICDKVLSTCADDNGDEICDVCALPMVHTNGATEQASGTITFDKTSAATGQIVTVTVTPAEGKRIESVIATTQDGTAIQLADAGDGTYTFIQPSGSVTVQAVFVDKPFSIAMASMTMANSLDMNFAFKQSFRDDWTGYYAKIEKEYEGAENAVQYIYFKDWKTTTINGEAYYFVTFTGIAAKEMTDKLYVTIYDANGEAVSTVWEDSVQAQAMRNLAKETITAESRTMVVDMLNYGVAAQQRFEYKLNDLANGMLTEEQMGYATKSASYVDTSSHGSNYRANVYLLSNIQFMMAFSGIDQSMNAVVTFTDHYGKAHEIRISGSEFTQNGSYYVVTIEQTVIADAYQNITCKIYDKNGKLVTQATDSMASYAARAKQNTGNELYEMIMRFAASSYAYMHKK